MELMWTGGLGCICYLMAQVVAAWLRFFASQIFGTANPEKTSNWYMCHVFWDVKKRRGYAVATLRISKRLPHELDMRSVSVQMLWTGGLGCIWHLMAQVVLLHGSDYSRPTILGRQYPRKQVYAGDAHGPCVIFYLCGHATRVQSGRMACLSEDCVGPLGARAFLWGPLCKSPHVHDHDVPQSRCLRQ